MQSVLIEILDIIDTSAQGVRILTKTGRRPWIPREGVRFLPRAVMVPEWLARRIAGRDSQ